MSDADDLPLVSWTQPREVRGLWTGVTYAGGHRVGRVQLAGALTLRSRVVARGEIVALEWNATLADLLRQLPLPRGTRGLRGAALTFTYDGRTTFTVRRGTQTVSADLPAPMPATPPTGVCRLCGTPMPGSKGKWYCSDFCSSEAHRRLVAARRGRHATLP